MLPSRFSYPLQFLSFSYGPPFPYHGSEGGQGRVFLGSEGRSGRLAEGAGRRDFHRRRLGQACRRACGGSLGPSVLRPKRGLI